MMSYFVDKKGKNSFFYDIRSCIGGKRGISSAITTITLPQRQLEVFFLLLLSYGRSFVLLARFRHSLSNHAICSRGKITLSRMILYFFFPGLLPRARPWILRNWTKLALGELLILHTTTCCQRANVTSITSHCSIHLDKCRLFNQPRKASELDV